jgi:hypothetical protein
LEWIDYEQSLCSGCGHERAESFDPAHAFDWHVEVLQCHACAARDRAAKSRSANSNADHAGIFFTVALEEG